jgi:hypothetical protein
MRNALYILAAVPAGYLPVAYVWMIGHVVCSIFSLSEFSPAEGSPLALGGYAAIYATVIQWPFYFAWAAFSSEISLRQRIAWLVVLFLGNMFAMPYFLWCKYTGTTQEGLLRIVGRARLRKYLAR